MSGSFRDLFRLPVVSAAILPVNTFATMPGGAVPAANAAGVGVVQAANAAIGDRVSLALLGTTQVISGAAIAAGASIGTDATGKAITWVSGGLLGRAMEAATGAGQLIEVYLLPN